MTMSDFWLRSNDHIKLKNAEVGYSFKKLADKYKIGRIRIYASGQNVLVIKQKFIPGMDPEQLDGANASRGFLYPLTSSYIVGIKLDF
jgi:hypothetical protein